MKVESVSVMKRDAATISDAKPAATPMDGNKTQRLRSPDVTRGITAITVTECDFWRFMFITW